MNPHAMVGEWILYYHSLGSELDILFLINILFTKQKVFSLHVQEVHKIVKTGKSNDLLFDIFNSGKLM